MSRLTRLLLVGCAALLLIVLLGWAWLWHSHSGLVFVLNQSRGAMVDGVLRWDSAEGTLADGARLRGVVVRAGLLELKIAQAQLALVPRAIWRGTVRVERLHMSGVQLRQLPTNVPEAPFVWPSSWPALPLPLTIEVPALSVRGLQLPRDKGPPLPVSAIDGSVRIASGQVRVTALTIRRAGEAAQLDGYVGLGVRSEVDLTLAGGSLPDATTQWQLQAHATGHPADLQLAIAGNAPGPVSVHARVRQDGGRLHWQLDGRAQSLVPAIFGGPEGRYGGEFSFDGIDAAATVSGQLQRDDQHLQLLPSQVAWQDGQVLLSPLVLSVLDGEVSITGAVGVEGETPVLALQIKGDALQWGSDDARVTAGGSAQLRGTLAQWQLDGSADLQRQTLVTQIALRAHGDQQRASLDQLRLTTGAGQSQLTGTLVFSPSVRWQTTGTINGFDPGFFASGFPGVVSANFDSDGAIVGDALQFMVDLDAMSGRVRGRTVSGHAQLGYHDGRSTGALDLHVGNSHVIASGQYDASGKIPVSLRAKFAPLLLDDLLPDGHGSLSGELALSGADHSAVVRGEMHGEHLAWNAFSVDALHLHAGPAADAGTRIELSLDAAASGGINLAQLQADVSGTLTKARWSMRATADMLAANATGYWSNAKTLRRVDLQTFSLSPTRGNRWQLLGPASLTLGDVMALSPLCLAQASARVCLQGNWPGEFEASVHALDLSLLDPLLHRGEVPFGLDGHVEGNATLRGDAARVTQGKAQLRVSPGALQVLPRGKQPALAWQAITVNAGLAGDAVEISIDAKTSAEGALRGQLATGLADDATLAGALYLDVAQLAWLELFSPDIAAPHGRLRGQLTVAGSRQSPQLSGQLLLSDFAAELPALGIALADSRAQLDAGSDGSLHLDARLDSGDGPLRVVADGSLASAQAFTVRLSGERVKLIDNADLRAWISPDLDIVRADKGFSVTGRLLVPEAHIALDKMQAGAAARSPDVRILDPVEAQSARKSVPVALDVQASFGTSVELTGFGLNGKLGGDLRVTQVPGREPLGTGTLNVSGSYQRYGKPLTIRRARLGYTRTPLDNPALDIRAERSIDTQMVGVQVSGSALNPTTTLVSTPALDNNETLSWLVLGRPLRSAQQGDGEKLSAAASALGAGGNLLAEQLGERLGLDAAEVGESRTLGVNTLSVGKFISPRLYVSYGVSLLGTGQVVALKYLLGNGFELEIESGQESRGSINWQTER